jgi:hypothetical protein
MPTVYRVEILNHDVDRYETAEEKLRTSKKRLTRCVEDERVAWDQWDNFVDKYSPSTLTQNDRAHARRRATEATREKYAAEHERDLAQIEEQRAMRALCDAVLLATKGADR